MNLKILAAGALCAMLVGMACVGGFAQSSATIVDGGAAQKFTFILFWKDNNGATQTMAATLKDAIARRSEQAEWIAINVADPANQETVDRYKVSRAPMPLVMCVAANGAITTAVTDQLTEEAIERALVTPTMTHCVKALQEGKLVLVHVMPDDRSPMPQGAREFAADPSFQARTTTVSLRRDDPNEARFLTDMKIDARANGSVIALLAPPSVIVGRFSESATKDDIAAELHAAGKCCNDPNCKHNKKGN